MWCPTSLEVNGEVTQYPLPEPSLPLNFIHSTGLRYEAEEVRQCLLKGRLYTKQREPLNITTHLTKMTIEFAPKTAQADRGNGMGICRFETNYIAVRITHLQITLHSK